MKEPLLMTPRLELAIRTAATAHSKQTRKGGILPYIIHPFSVMYIAQSATNDEDTLVACLFHDIIEDVPEEYPEDRMREEFGQRVVDIVRGVTKDPNLNDWQETANAYLENLQNNAPLESITVAAADKIHNMMSVIADHQSNGEDVWTKFSSDKAAQLWWYDTVYDVITARDANHPLLDHYQTTLAKLKALPI